MQQNEDRVSKRAESREQPKWLETITGRAKDQLRRNALKLTTSTSWITGHRGMLLDLELGTLK
eukprot:scaffold733_cov77-Skeletonema_dohrnii-CCMP3373.AAC.2